MKTLSIIGKDYHTEEHVIGYCDVGDRMLCWKELGVLWGGFWRVLFGECCLGSVVWLCLFFLLPVLAQC